MAAQSIGVPFGRGALSDSSIDGLYIHHTKVGLWFDGAMHNLTVSNTIVADVVADGVNFRRGVTNSKVVNSFFRNTADDGMAMWSEYLRMMVRRRVPASMSSSPSRRCSVTSVPRAGRSTGAHESRKVNLSLTAS